MLSNYGRRFASSIPKKIHGIPGRYAEAVYIAASKVGMLEKVEGELLAFKDIMIKSPDFNSFITNPTIQRKEKYDKIAEMIDESKFSHIGRNLFLTLSANGRIGEVAKIINAYQEIMQAGRGTVQVTIISSEALKKKQLESVEAGVMAMIGKGKTVEIITKVDESILGGIQVKIGVDKLLDLSVASRVGELAKDLETVN